jgi:hypothetical protein
MSKRRQSPGDYRGGSTVLSRSGWGFSKAERSPKKKDLERKKRLKAEAERFYAQREARKKGKSRT